MTDTQGTTSARERATPEAAAPVTPDLTTVTRLAELAGQSIPHLRPTFTEDEQQEEAWATECPAWCAGWVHEGHRPEQIVNGPRRHEGATVRVRQDGGYGYYDEEGDEEGIRTAHLQLSLVTGSREYLPRVKIDALYGGEGGARRVFHLAPLFLDEARELIAVLELLIGVAEHAAAE